MPRIELLSESLINQIAAGEVVERPASVIKELGENALDAGARTLRIAVRGGGVESLSVADDGVGMAREDAERCLLRHATSKLRDAAGLLAISTLGFRGEALAAIAAVSRLTLSTAERGSERGSRMTCEGGRAGVAEDTGPTPGTYIQVEDLFFNVPARRKFLRKAETELRHIEEAVWRLALGHPAVGFTLELDGKVRFACAPESDERERFVAALGPDLHAHLLPLDERRLGLRIFGWVASPELTFSTARGLYAFVNRRYVRDRALTSAIQRAFGASLPYGRQPVAAVYLDLDPASVDVNVHPQKTEVRFGDPRGVAEAVGAAIARALREAPWNRAAPLPADQSPHYAQAVETFLGRLNASSASEGGLTAVGSALGPGINEAAPPGYFSRLRYLGPLGDRFLVTEGPGATLVLLDVHAAWERIHREAFARRFAAAKSASGIGDRGLAGGTVKLPRAEAERILLSAGSLARFGIELEPFGADSFAVRAVPPAFHGHDLSDLLVELASALPTSGGTAVEPSLTEESAREAIALLACRAASADARVPGPGEVQSLLEELDTVSPHPGARHPRVVALEVPHLELLRRAGETLTDGARRVP